MYDQWVKWARFHEPEIAASAACVEDYLDTADHIYEKYYSTALRRDLRLGDYVRRIPVAIARADFSDVTDEIVEEAKGILVGSMREWG